MSKSTNNVSADISLKGQKLEEVISFRYMGRSNPVQRWLSRNPQSASPEQWQQRQQRPDEKGSSEATPSAWRASSSCTFILQYSCEKWTLLADSEKRIQASETKCLKKLLRISYLEHRPTTGCRTRLTPSRTHKSISWQLSREGKLVWFGHVIRHDSLPKPSFRARWRVADAMDARLC